MSIQTIQFIVDACQLIGLSLVALFVIVLIKFIIDNATLKKFARVTLVFCSAILVTIAIGVGFDTRAKERRHESNYTVYIDGREVNPDTIDINQYQYSANDETKKIFLTK